MISSESGCPAVFVAGGVGRQHRFFGLPCCCLCSGRALPCPPYPFPPLPIPVLPTPAHPCPVHPIPPHPCPSLPCPAFRALLVRLDASGYEQTLCSLRDGTDMESITILLQVRKGPCSLLSPLHLLCCLSAPTPFLWMPTPLGTASSMVPAEGTKFVYLLPAESEWREGKGPF